MQRDEAEALIRKFYAARFGGDANSALSHVVEDVHLHIMGSAEQSPVAFKGTNADHFRESFSLVVENFEFQL